MASEVPYDCARSLTDSFRAASFSSTSAGSSPRRGVAPGSPRIAPLVRPLVGATIAPLRPSASASSTERGSPAHLTPRTVIAREHRAIPRTDSGEHLRESR